MANSRYVRPWLPYNIFCGKYDPIQLHRKIICTSKCSDFQKKVIDTISTSNLYFKENNENEIAAQVFLGVFFSIPADGRSKLAQQLM